MHVTVLVEMWLMEGVKIWDFFPQPRWRCSCHFVTMYHWRLRKCQCTLNPITKPLHTWSYQEHIRKLHVHSDPSIKHNKAPQNIRHRLHTSTSISVLALIISQRIRLWLSDTYLMEAAIVPSEVFHEQASSHTIRNELAYAVMKLNQIFWSRNQKAT